MCRCGFFGAFGDRRPGDNSEMDEVLGVRVLEEDEALLSLAALLSLDPRMGRVMRSSRGRMPA